MKHPIDVILDEQGISQSALARLLDIRPSAISNMRKRNYRMSGAVALRAHEIFPQYCFLFLIGKAEEEK